MRFGWPQGIWVVVNLFMMAGTLMKETPAGWSRENHILATILLYAAETLVLVWGGFFG